MSNTEIEQASSPDSATDVQSEPVASAETNGRRRLFKAGLGAAPVVMTLASRPVLAWHCQTPSAFGSINRSRVHNDCVNSDPRPSKSCTGSGGWDTASTWPSGCSKTTKFKTVFGGNDYGDATCLDVLKQQGLASGASEFHRCLLCAYLNVKDNRGGGCLSLAQIGQMYTQTYKPFPSFVPAQAGASNLTDWYTQYMKKNWIGAVYSSDFGGSTCQGIKPGFYSG